MPNLHKLAFLNEIQKKFGNAKKLEHSQSLFALCDGAARIYVRYSKVHESSHTFFGLREVDLRQLEGHNSFLCFLTDAGSPAILIPYQDFEEIFRRANTARDAQYKVQLLSRQDAIELYVAGMGRFNVNGYVGTHMLERSLSRERLRDRPDLSHSQVQTLLAGIGHLKGYEIYVPTTDVGRLDWSITKTFALRHNIPSGFEPVGAILSEIDVIWLSRGRDSIEGLFEVEHSTSIYSGLLRFNDVLLVDPKLSRFSIVSNDARRSEFSRQVSRPTFRRSGLAELTSFLEYANVYDWHQRLAKGESNAY